MIWFRHGPDRSSVGAGVGAFGIGTNGATGDCTTGWGTTCLSGIPCVRGGWIGGGIFAAVIGTKPGGGGGSEAGEPKGTNPGGGGCEVVCLNGTNPGGGGASRLIERASIRHRLA